MKKPHDIEKFIQHYKKSKEAIYDCLVEDLGQELVDEILSKLKKEHGDNYKSMKSQLESFAGTFGGYFIASGQLKHWEEKKEDKSKSTKDQNNGMER